LNRAENLGLALIQTDLVWHNAHANRTGLQRQLEKAAGADLVILPEMFSTGFSMASAALAEAEDGPTSRWLSEQARQLGAVLTGSLMIRAQDGRYRNRLLWARPDGSSDYYDKRHLFRMAGEHQHYSAGERQVTFTLKGWRVRPLICYDLRFPVWSRDPSSTDLLLYTANWPAARHAQWQRLLPARAIENLCYVAAVNRLGLDGEQRLYAGGSQVLDFQGEALLDSGAQAGVFRQRLDLAALHAYRNGFPAHQDADSFALR
jgi:omega-amidase